MQVNYAKRHFTDYIVNNWNQLRQGEIKTLEIILESLSNWSIMIKMQSKYSVFSAESGSCRIL